MRPWICLVCALTLGCGVAATPVNKTTDDTINDEKPTATSSPEAALPPDLGTRKDGNDWPSFLGPTGDSISLEKGILAPWPEAGPRLVWEKRLGTGYGMPAISRGRLFLFDRIRNRARVQCLKSETAESLWTFEYHTNYEDYYGYNNGPRCFPVVDRDRVYVYGAEGMLHCLRAEDGKLIWKVDTKVDFGVVQNFFGVGSTPVVEGDLLIAVVGGSPRGSQEVPFGDLKGNGSGIVAFDKYTGKVKYKITDQLAGYAPPVLATVGDRRWCFAFARGGLVGFEPATGKVDFEFPWRAPILESVNASSPVVVGNRVFISETYGPGSALLEFGPGKVKEVWTDADKRRKSMQCHWNTPIHVDGYLYGCSGRHTGNAELRCIELATGKVTWSVPELTRTSLLLVDGHFICLGEDGILRLLKVNPKKYEEMSCVELRPLGKNGKPDATVPPLLQSPAWAAPILSHGLLYVRGKDRLVCLELIPVKK
jgi:outer membrane protein assembly factor BamB